MEKGRGGAPVAYLELREVQDHGEREEGVPPEEEVQVLQMQALILEYKDIWLQSKSFLSE